MFDLTKEVKLNKESLQKYRIFQVLLYFFSFAFGIYVFLSIAFPTAYFSFSFLNPSSTKNNIVRPRNAENILPDRGKVSTGEKMDFDASLFGSYSKAIIMVDLAKKSDPISNGKISVKKSYQDFFYPAGDPIDYFYEKNSGEFPDGSLVAYGDAVYAISSDNFFPIDSVETFLAQGYSWDDLIQASADQLASYRKGKLMSLSSPHPDGTILSSDDGKFYLIQNGQKHPFVSKEVADSWMKKNPIAVSSKSLKISESCYLEKKTFTRDTYSCEIPIDKFKNLIGKDFEFSAQFGNDVKVDNLYVEFKKDWSLANFKLRISEMIFRTKNNYSR